MNGMRNTKNSSTSKIFLQKIFMIFQWNTYCRMYRILIVQQYLLMYMENTCRNCSYSNLNKHARMEKKLKTLERKEIFVIKKVRLLVWLIIFERRMRRRKMRLLHFPLSFLELLSEGLSHLFFPTHSFLRGNLNLFCFIFLIYSKPLNIIRHMFSRAPNRGQIRNTIAFLYITAE